MTDKCSEWRLLSNGELTGTQVQPSGPHVYFSTAAAREVQGPQQTPVPCGWPYTHPQSKHIWTTRTSTQKRLCGPVCEYQRPPNHCRKLEASDLQTSKHPSAHITHTVVDGMGWTDVCIRTWVCSTHLCAEDDPRCDFDSSFIRFLRDLHIAKYVNVRRERNTQTPDASTSPSVNMHSSDGRPHCGQFAALRCGSAADHQSRQDAPTRRTPYGTCHRQTNTITEQVCVSSPGAFVHDTQIVWVRRMAVSTGRGRPP